MSVGTVVEFKMLGKDQVSAELRKVERSMGKVRNELRTLSPAANKAKGRMNALGKATQRVGKMAMAARAGVAAFVAALAVTAVRDFVTAGEKAANVAERFRGAVARPTEALAQAQVATRGLVEATDLQIVINRFQRLGVPIERTMTLLELSTKAALDQGKDVLQVTGILEGAVKGRTSSLSSLGLMLPSISDLTKAHAAATGRAVSEISDLERKELALNVALAELGRQFGDVDLARFNLGMQQATTNARDFLSALQEEAAESFGAFLSMFTDTPAEAYEESLLDLTLAQKELTAAQNATTGSADELAEMQDNVSIASGALMEAAQGVGLALAALPPDARASAFKSLESTFKSLPPAAFSAIAALAGVRRETQAAGDEARATAQALAALDLARDPAALAAAGGKGAVKPPKKPPGGGGGGSRRRAAQREIEKTRKAFFDSGFAGMRGLSEAAIDPAHQDTLNKAITALMGEASEMLALEMFGEAADTEGNGRARIESMMRDLETRIAQARTLKEQQTLGNRLLEIESARLEHAQLIHGEQQNEAELLKLRKTLEKGRASAAQIEETVAQKRVVLEEKLADSIAKSAKEREGMLADLAPFEEAARASDTLAASTALELRILREMDPIERMRLEHMRERERILQRLVGLDRGTPEHIRATAQAQSELSIATARYALNLQQADKMRLAGNIRDAGAAMSSVSGTMAQFNGNMANVLQGLGSATASFERYAAGQAGVAEASLQAAGGMGAAAAQSIKDERARAAVLSAVQVAYAAAAFASLNFVKGGAHLAAAGMFAAVAGGAMSGGSGKADTSAADKEKADAERRAQEGGFNQGQGRQVIVQFGSGIVLGDPQTVAGAVNQAVYSARGTGSSAAY